MDEIIDSPTLQDTIDFIREREIIRTHLAADVSAGVLTAEEANEIMDGMTILEYLDTPKSAKQIAKACVLTWRQWRKESRGLILLSPNNGMAQPVTAQERAM